MKNKGDYILVDTKNNVINYPPCLYAFGVEISCQREESQACLSSPERSRDKKEVQIYQNQYKIIKKVIEPTYRGAKPYNDFNDFA